MIRRSPTLPYPFYVAAGAIALASLGPAPAARVIPPLNEAVVGFARDQQGKQVGDGSCITLAIEALRHSGAKRVPLSRADGDYVWGRRIDQFKDARPAHLMKPGKKAP